MRPGGVPDGRRVCRVCLRRLLAWLHSLPETDLATSAAALWAERQPAAVPEGEGWRAAVREAFTRRVREALGAEDEPGRVQICIAYLEMRMPGEALEALARVAPEALDAGLLSERMLASLLSRLLDEHALAEGARERIQSTLYPAA
jgi:hypothetical protein